MSGQPLGWASERWSRRELLYRAGVGGTLAFGGAGLLAACGKETTEVSEIPRKGGVLRVGVYGGDSNQNVDPHNAFGTATWPRNFSLYDGLGWRTGTTFEPENRLAEEVSSNKGGDQWTVRIREGVEFHNGKTLSAEDVIYTIERILDRKQPTAAAAAIRFVGIKQLRALDDRTVRFTLAKPFGPFVDALYQPEIAIVPVDFDPRKPVGTGAFKYLSYTPGQESVFERFANYWRGPAYVDRVVITDINDDTARVNALLGGEVDAINGLPASQLGAMRKSSGLAALTSPTGDYSPLTMRVDVPPFKDVRVRQAMRLIADREAMVRQVMSGRGKVGNDVFSPYDPAYNDALPQRTQDIEQAKFLLKQAGLDNHSFELSTTAFGAGVVAASQVFARQAADAGVKITVRQFDTTTYQSELYGNTNFGVDYWHTLPYIGNVAQAFSLDAPYNTVHFNDPDYNRLLSDATQELDADKRRTLLQDMQQIDHDRGGFLIWGFSDVIDGYSTKLRGLRRNESKNGWPLNGYNFRELGFA